MSMTGPTLEERLEALEGLVEELQGQVEALESCVDVDGTTCTLGLETTVLQATGTGVVGGSPAIQISAPMGGAEIQSAQRMLLTTDGGSCSGALGEGGNIDIMSGCQTSIETEENIKLLARSDGLEILSEGGSQLRIAGDGNVLVSANADNNGGGNLIAQANGNGCFGQCFE